MEVDTATTPEHNQEFADVDINNGSVSGASDEEEVPAPGSVTLEQENDLFVSAMTPSEVHVSKQRTNIVFIQLSINLMGRKWGGVRAVLSSAYNARVLCLICDNVTESR